ncbi:MAG: GTPase HflX [Cyanobacteria bacterium]|nr:GTPase HflX [Cyanobacteriota bacterium]
MKQAVVAGRTAGLRPAERRRLDQICHRRHPADAVADLLTLQRLAAEAERLEEPLTLVVDGRGLCRLLWIGDLEASGRLLEKLPGSSRRQGSDLRLLTCAGSARQPPLRPGAREAVVGLDLAPRLWLRFSRQAAAGGHWPASLLIPQPSGEEAWHQELEGDLAALCNLDPAPLGDSGLEISSRQGASGLHRDTAAATPHQAAGSTAPGRAERVLLLVLISGEAGRDGRRLAELEGLVRSAGGEPVGVVGQRRSSGAAPTLWGEGKLREAALEARRLEASLVVTDRELTPVQARNLERIVDLPVSDRSELILDIFAQRAASAAGRLQVELAQLRYRLPRLSGRGLSLSRQGGGIGTRGPGETQLEKDRRAIARRIERLQRDVRELGEHRARLRQGRRGQRRLALVGYTNAGKSSLLNALSGARAGEGVLAENRLFATLDPTTRRVHLSPNDGSFPAANDPDEGAINGGRPHGSGDEESVPELPLLVTDTVGFIEDLPPQLVEAFRSTLEEALEADGLLLVVDLSDPAWPEQLTSVNALLDRLGATPPRLMIGNQIDRCPAGELDRAQALAPGMLFISATADLGLQNLRRHLSHWPASAVDPAAPADRSTSRTAAGSPRGPVPTSEG